MLNKSIPALKGRIIRCFLFDLGDTLWSRKDSTLWQQMEDASNARAAALLRQYLPSESLAELNDVALGKRLHEAVDKRIRKIIRQDPEVEAGGGHVVLHVLRKWGIENIDATVSAAIFEALRVRIPGSRPLFDDVLSTLAALQKRGFALGIVTNRHWGGASFHEDLKTLGLLDYFDLRYVAVSVDLSIRKPNPAIFLRVLNALNIPPEQAAMVGDSLRSDVLGAQRLGLFSIWKPKPDLREDIYAQKMSGNSLQPVHATLEARAGEAAEQLSSRMHITDDDYILAHIQSRQGKWDEHMQGDIHPDLMIENLSDLLDIFVKVGEQ